MRLLIATGLYSPEIGGPATYTAFLERHLPSHGIGLTVVPFRIVRGYPKLVRHIAYAFRLARAARRADVILALDTVSVGVPAMLASFLTRRPLYLRVPGDYAWEQGQQRAGLHVTLDEYLENGPRPLLVRVLAWLQKRVASSAHRIIVPSEYLKGVVRHWGIQGENVTVIHSAYHPIELKENRDELRARLKYEGYVVLTAGRLVPWKGMKTVIDAVALIRASGILISLDIVGEGEEYEPLRRHIEELSASGFVHLRGREPKRILSERVKAADTFILNTSYEGLSHQLLEVMDLGTPIVTTPVCGNIELIEDEKEGLLVPYDAKDAIVGALERLRTDTGLRTKLTEAARARVRAFSEDEVVKDLVNFFS
ncbi:MAG TPA: glycosyltransferase [Candidatus Paceibacterota bacterium]|nr:glycosyltransferase [Candidatus Paceibacterota bacterium]